MSTTAILRRRRDTAANWTSENPTPESGQLCFETDTGRSKLGDGTTAWTSLAYTFGGTAGTTDNRVIRADGTSGRNVQGSAVTVDDSGNITANGATLSTALAVGSGGTGATSASAARTNLGLEIGTNVPDYNAPRVHHTFCFASSAATAAAARTTGIVTSTAIASRQKTPSGKSFLVLGVSASVESGATAGTYTVKAVIYDHTGAAEHTLATFATMAASTVEQVEAVGTISSPLATITASKTFSIGWANDASSPGALSTNQRAIFVTGIFV